ncbi:lamin tail domain-containing protein [Pyxidicoccus parkwayensis]|uniref:Lamin tail domain-containing protein n=1 Tax=Pyxidicoccus parkwayensis TaxID=2813578 RepID=A0ABX7P5X7_9BACT|nr:lamin tail domain-containing protein [Pyxidicoccus parkwaysis]QSQ25848.1 lamin tail domain-containing protein [Pyxidicoccus parkwaysis]
MPWSFRQLLAPLSALLLLMSACSDDPECGNGVVESGEQCDDGNTADGDSCPANCQSAPVTDGGSAVCGNGHVEGTERCDDGNRTPGDGCENDCTFTPETERDSGVTTDAGSDAGVGTDAGTTTDAGSETDAGSVTDAGSETDAGSSTDAGSVTDAGTGTGETDAGSVTDAGTGEPDAGSTTDAGSGNTDAGSSTDAGSGTTDGGSGEPDAGPGDTDAGSSTDAGTDAGTDVDAGPGDTDAGSNTDAGTDAGSDIDAGPGDTDAGSSTDAGTDAGSDIDAGPGDTDGGTDAGTDTDAGTGTTDAGTDAGTGTTDAGTDAGTSIDAGTTQVALADFGPTGNFARSGFSGPTFPDALRVTLKEAAPTDVWVEIASSSRAVTVEGGNLVRVPAGATSAVVIVSADLAADPGVTKAVLTVTNGTDSLQATVRVLAVNQPASLSLLTPEAAVVAGGAKHTFTVSLDVPPAVDTDVLLSVQPATLGSVPTRVTVAANTLSAKFDFTAADSAGQGQVVATLGSQSAASTVQVTGSGANHVVISELAARGPGTGTAADNDEFVELYNPTASTVDISGWKIQYRSASGAAYNTGFALPAGSSIAPRGYFLVGSGSYAPAGGAAKDANWGTTLTLGAGGGHIRIGTSTLGTTVDDPATVDKLGYGTAIGAEGSAITTTPATTGSYERKANANSTAASMETGSDALKGNGQDTDNNAADFVLRTTRQPQNKASAKEP